MPDTIVMMGNTQGFANLKADKCKADGWHGHTDGLHTVVVQVVNFTGRIYIEASLEINPTENDWFPIKLTEDSFLEFPQNPMVPTGNQGIGDTATIGLSFKINALWLRAKLDRTYLNDVLYEEDPDALLSLGNVKKITLAR